MQSERGDIYARSSRSCSRRLAYRCYCTREEIEAREAARPKGAPSGYDGFCRNLSRAADRGAGGAVAAVGGADAGARRSRSPSTTWSAARSPSRPTHVPDFVIVRGNGEPLYTLVNPVDDSLMEITHVLRGEDLLPSTPRQIVLYEALAADRRRQRAHPDLRSSADGAG